MGFTSQCSDCHKTFVQKCWCLLSGSWLCWLRGRLLGTWKFQQVKSYCSISCLRWEPKVRREMGRPLTVSMTDRRKSLPPAFLYPKLSSFTLSWENGSWLKSMPQLFIEWLASISLAGAWCSGEQSHRCSKGSVKWELCPSLYSQQLSESPPDFAP
jgi:hypothetical protein